MKTQNIQLTTLTGTQVSKKSNLALLQYIDQLDEIQKTIDEQREALRSELLYRVDEKQEKTQDPTAEIQVADRIIKSIPVRLWGGVDLDFAKKHNATKEVPDSKKLEILFNEGKDIPGLKTTERLSISKIKKEKK